MRKMIDIDFGSSRYEQLVELRYKVLLEPLGLKFLDSHRDKEVNYLHIGCVENLDDKGLSVKNRKCGNNKRFHKQKRRINKVKNGVCS